MTMAITLNHTIVPCHDKVESAQFYARVFGFELIGEFSHFIVVRVNDTLTLDFDNADSFESHHYAFKVTDEDFDRIFARLETEGLAYGSGPYATGDRKINHNYGGRGVYFKDGNGHILEMITTDYEMP